MKNHSTDEPKGTSPPTRQDNNAVIEDLARKASRGDCDALLALCQISAKNVLFRVMRLIPDKMDAEDTAQEILLNLCENIGELKEPKAFGGWLNTIIINETNRFLSKNNKHNNVEHNIDDYYDTIQEENEDFLPFEYAIREENRKSIMKIVDSLPKRQLEAVMLHYYDGMSMSEAASAMKMTVQGVSRYLMLARGKIKKELEKLDGAEKATRSLAFLPMGQLLGQLLGEQAGRIPITDSAWIEHVMNSCANTITGTAAGGVGVASVVTKASVSLIKPVVIAASFLTVMVSTAGIWYSFGPQKPLPPLIPAAQEITGSVEFSGGESGVEHLNPKDATVTTSGGSGEITVVGWVVTMPDGETTVLSGDDDNVSKAFTELFTTGADGEYFLTYSLKDTYGREYRVGRSFYIMSGIESETEQTDDQQ